MKNEKKVVLSKRQREGMMRNFGGMSVKAQKNYAPDVISVIIMMAAIVPVIKGKLGVSNRSSDGSLLLKARAIFTSLTANANGFYTVAFTGLARIDTQATAFEDAMIAMSQGVPGAEGIKAAARTALNITLFAALGYVNNLAFLNQPNAVAIITGASMVVIGRSGVKKQDFSVKQGPASGEIKLSSIAAKLNFKYVVATYYWQYSTDNGTTWNSLDNTPISRTVATGMKVNVLTLFRKRITTVSGGTTAWSVPISIVPM